MIPQEIMDGPSKKHKKSRMARGTQPGVMIEGSWPDEEVTKEYKVPKETKQPASLHEDVAGIMEGLNKAGAMIAKEKSDARKAAAETKRAAALQAEKEEREWDTKIAQAKQRIAAEGEIPSAPKAEAKGKPFGAKEKATMEAKLAGEEEARWEGKEWEAKTKAAKEDVEWEEKEWSAKTNVAENKSFWDKLREKIGLKRKNERK